MRLLFFILPIVIYFLTEQTLGPVYAFVVALALCVGQASWNKFKFGSFNWRDSIADMVLLLIFGICDLVADYYWVGASNVLTSCVFTAILWFSLIPQLDIFLNMARNLMPKQAESPYFQSLMRNSRIRMAVWATIYSMLMGVAFFAKDSATSHWLESYALVAILAAYLASEILFARFRKKKYENSEWVVLLNENGDTLGGCPRPLVHNGSGWLHAVVHLHVIHNGQLLLQLRPQNKKIQPGKWDTAVGGHIAFGEDLKKALARETFEEIGLQNFEARLVRTYIWNSDVENEYVFVFQTDSKGPFETKNVGEVDELKFWSRQELIEAMSQDSLTGNLKKELREGLLDQLK